jgi:hypothetical protein
LAAAVFQSWDAQHNGPESSDHLSHAVRLLIESLAPDPDSQILDVGPVCSENINFFGRQVHRVYLCDMFMALNLALRENRNPSEIWGKLDYPPESFDAVLLWDFVDRLADQDLGRMVEICAFLVKAGGMIMVFARGELSVPTAVHTFAVSEGFRVHQRLQPHLSLPFHGRQNRQLLARLAPFAPVKSYMHRNGLREMLLRPR